MKVNTEHGIQDLYLFELEEINASLHSHPALEIIYSPSTNFTIYTEQHKYQDASCYLIRANVPHSITSNKGHFKICMIDSVIYNEASLINHFQLTCNPVQAIPHSVLDSIISTSLLSAFIATHIFPVSEIVDQVYSSSQSLLVDRSSLADQYGISPSRMSHIIKSNTGISLSTLIAWQKMRLSFSYLIDKTTTIQSSAFNSGFYDHPQFSRTFKRFFGVTPSSEYNDSTIIQGE